MIETTCACGKPFTAGEDAIGKEPSVCGLCGQSIQIISAETLADGAGAGDFDAHLIVQSGPDRVGDQFLLGGVEEITIGKLPERNIVLAAGQMVSRHHCTLARLDFGPSRWELRDNNSKNGLWINGDRVQSQELRDGNLITIGDYQLKFASSYERDLAAAKTRADQAAIAAGAPVCPSCGRVLNKGAKICTNCGVDVKTGRSLVVSKGLDENELATRADTWIRTVSWLMWLGIFPIASEAFGTRKPLATWIIFGTTVLASVMFLIAVISAGDEMPSSTVMNMMQWNGNEQAEASQLAQVQQKFDELKQEQAEQQARPAARERRDPSELTDEDLEQLASMIGAKAKPEGVGFHWYQLFTSATLHEPALFRPFLFHLGGNMLFLLVFGLRVNELIGTWRMAVAYIVLIFVSGLSHHLATAHGMVHPSLGASGAVMGLAGMYFIFFPVQRVHMAIWFRGGFLTGWRCFYKVWAMRGFWLLILWIGLNDVLPIFFGLTDDVAHWAHLGGFIGGVVLATALLISRQVSAHGNDILSITLGKHAWGLVGRPAAHVA